MTIKHVLFVVAPIAACTGQQGPQNDGPPPAAYALRDAEAVGYTIGITAGDQMFNAILDTGSTTLGIVGANCSDCTGISPVYTPDASAMDMGSAVDATYGKGGWMGELYSDSISVTGDTLAPIDMKFAEIEEQTDFFGSGGTPDAIVGFGPALAELPDTDSYVTERIDAGDSGVFAIQMCPYDGTLWFGGADKTHEVSDEQYTAFAPITSEQPYYLVDVQSASVGGTSIGLSGAAVPDTGTTIMYMPTEAANAFAAAVNASSGFESIFGGQTFEISSTQWQCSLQTTMSASAIDAALPKFEVTLNDLDGKPFTLEMPATQSYLHSFGDFYCVDVGVIADAPAIILGDAFLNNFVSVYDAANSKIGFAPQQGCTYPMDAKVPVVPRRPLVHGHPAYYRGA